MEISLSDKEIEFFTTKAKEKISMENWGKRSEIKAANFADCYITEEAFKKLLGSKGLFFRHRGLYVGDVSGAGHDFTVRLDGVEKSIGLRCISSDSLNIWKSMAYPNDRFEDEQDMIADYIVVCTRLENVVSFHGFMSKKELVKAMTFAKVMLSKKNKEKFRTVPLERFSADFEKWFNGFDRVQ